MLKIYFYDFENQIQLSIHEPLEASLEQTLEVYQSVSQNSNSYMGIISLQGHTVEFSKYNKFVWKVEIPHKRKKGSYQIFLTPTKLKNLIIELFEGKNPMKINGLMFEK